MRILTLLLLAVFVTPTLLAQDFGDCGFPPPPVPPEPYVYLEIVGDPPDSYVVEGAAKDALREAGIVVGDRDSYSFLLTLAVVNPRSPVVALSTTLSSRAVCAVYTEQGPASMSYCDSLIDVQLRTTDDASLAASVRAEVVDAVAIMSRINERD